MPTATRSRRASKIGTQPGGDERAMLADAAKAAAKAVKAPAKSQPAKKAAAPKPEPKPTVETFDLADRFLKAIDQGFSRAYLKREVESKLGHPTTLVHPVRWVRLRSDERDAADFVLGRIERGEVEVVKTAASPRTSSKQSRIDAAIKILVAAADNAKATKAEIALALKVAKVLDGTEAAS
jgi:hypothetical protein